MESLKQGKYSYYTLSNGTKIPPIGFGTMKLNKETMLTTINTAIQSGFRLFDTAKRYDNEDALGETLKTILTNNPNIKREDLYIVTKMWIEDQRDPINALKTSLEKLKLNYVDLYLVHWPLGEMENGIPKKKVPLHVLWSNFEKCVEMGLCKSIGVSNFNAQLLLDLMSYAKIPPVVNQIEINPYFTQKELVNSCKALNIKVMAYMPACIGASAQSCPEVIGKNSLVMNETIISIAKRFGISPIQVILNWHLQRGTIPLPRSNNPEHIKENYQTVNYEICEKDVEEINKLNKNLRLNNGKGKDWCKEFGVFS